MGRANSFHYFPARLKAGSKFHGIFCKAKGNTYLTANLHVIGDNFCLRSSLRINISYDMVFHCAIVCTTGRYVDGAHIFVCTARRLMN